MFIFIMMRIFQIQIKLLLIHEEKDDNTIKNLQWCTLSQNSNHSKRTTQVRCKHNDETITFESCSEGAKWLSQNDARNKSTENFIRQSCPK